MKQLILFVLFYALANVSYSQDSIQLKCTKWAGGVCCSHGENFHLSIPKSIAGKTIDSLWVFIPGFRIHVSAKLLIREKKKSRASFGWEIYTESESNDVIQEKTYFGIEKSEMTVIPNEKSPQKVTVFYSRGKSKEYSLNFTVEQVAYP